MLKYSNDSYSLINIIQKLYYFICLLSDITPSRYKHIYYVWMVLKEMKYEILCFRIWEYQNVLEPQPHHNNIVCTTSQ